MRPGPRNSICDVDGLRVGHAEDHRLLTGTTVLVADRPNTASVHVMGGAPGTRDTDLLDPQNSVPGVDALFLSGGSAFGLDAGGGAMDALRAMGRGFAVGPARVPIVPGAILFDLLVGEPFAAPPYARFAREAVERASEDVMLGSVGAGTGATVGAVEGPLRGGIGTASAVLPDGTVVGALVAINSVGSPVHGARLRAAAFERGEEFGGLGVPVEPEADALPIKRHARTGGNTTIGIVATDARLSKGGCRRLAVAAHDGLARAVWPAHTAMDGDLFFALATNEREVADPIALGAAATAVTARAIARGVWEARGAPGAPPAFRDAS